MLFNRLTLCHPLLFVFNLSQLQGLFLTISSFYQVAKVLEPQCQHHSFQLIFRVDFPYDWLVWTPCHLRDSQKSLLQHHNSKASILWHSTFFMVQISHPYMTTGKTIALTRRTFVCKVMSLLFNMLCRLVIALHPKSKHLLISWLQSPSTVILTTAAATSLQSCLTLCNRESILKSRDITLPTKVCLVRATVFPVVMYGCEIWTVKKEAEHRRIDAFELWCWRSLGLQGDTTNPFWRKSTLGFLWKERC